LFRSSNKISTLAVAFAAAFFLYGEKPKVIFVSGKVEYVELVDDKANNIGILENNSSIQSNYLIATAKGSRTQIHYSSKIWRLGSLSAARLIDEDSFWIHSGSALFCSEENTTVHFSSIESNATFNGKGTIIVEATSNGGFKFIPLEAEGTISTSKGGVKNITEGQMLLILGQPSEFGDAYDIDLMLLVKSSRLLNYFPTPLSTFDQIGLAIYVQQLKLKGKYDALIGDATSNENLQMWKFGKNVGVESSTSKSLESKKGFFQSFFGKE
jgi:hypothetical protein